MDDAVVIDLIFENGIDKIEDYDEIRAKLSCVSTFFRDFFSFEDKRKQVRLILERVIDLLIITMNLSWRFFPKSDQLFLALNRFALRWEKQIIECLSFDEYFKILRETYEHCWIINDNEKLKWEGWVNGKFVCVSRLWGIKLTMFYKNNHVKQLFPQIFPFNLIMSLIHINIMQIINYHSRLKMILKNDENRKIVPIASRRLISLVSLSDLGELGELGDLGGSIGYEKMREGSFYTPPCYELLKMHLHEKFFPRYLDPTCLIVYDSFGIPLTIIENESQNVIQNYLTNQIQQLNQLDHVNQHKCIDLLIEIDKFDSIDIEIFKNIQRNNLSLYQNLSTDGKIF